MTVFGSIRSVFLACVALAFVLSPIAAVPAAQADEAFGIAMHGAPALPADVVDGTLARYREFLAKVTK